MMQYFDKFDIRFFANRKLLSRKLLFSVIFVWQSLKIAHQNIAGFQKESLDNITINNEIIFGINIRLKPDP